MTGHNPTDRSKLGSKRHILTDKDGIPLSTIITSANTHDVTVATNTIDNIVIKRPSYNKSKHKQNLCLDKAYHSNEVEQEIIKRGYIPHIRHRREERIFHRKYPARRWVVERTNYQKRIHTTYTTQKRRKKRKIIKTILQEDGL